MNVLFASSDYYSPLLLISLTSLLDHNANDFECINIYVLDDGITEDNKNKIRNKVMEYNCRIFFIKTINLEEMDFNMVSLDRDSIPSLTTYVRLFISSLLPKNIDKILYLDSDSLIVNSFKELWDEDISDYYCAGVQDCTNTTYKERLGYSKDSLYINAGVLYINLKKWREDNVEERFIEFLIDNQYRFYQQDQGVINEVFENKIKLLPPKYNLQRFFQSLDYDLAKKYCCIETEYYSKEIVKESQENPVFIHFCAADYFRPWRNPNHPYAKMFQDYAKSLNCEYLIDYTNGFNHRQEWFQKLSENKIGIIFLNLIPFSVVKHVINTNAMRDLEENFERAKAK